MTITTEDILQHHGVKGMKWGVRKDRPKSKSQVAAEKTVSSRKADFKDAQSKYRKDTMYGAAQPSKAVAKELKSAKRELRYANDDLKKVKILEKLDSKPKSAQQLKAEEKYKSQGFNDDEAAVQAYKNIKVKQAIAVTAGTVVTIGTVYAGYKISDEFLDKTIKSGSSLQNITSESNQGVRDAFYSSSNKLDKIKYSGMYGKHLDTVNGKAFAKEIKVMTDIKRVSPKNAQKALQELVDNDPEFAKGMRDFMKADRLRQTLGDDTVTRAGKSLADAQKGKVSKGVYETFNTALVDHSPDMQKLTDKYYSSLSKKGYNAIKDVNDSKYSGYDAISPIIAFNTKGKVSVVNVRELAKDEIRKHNNVAVSSIVGKELFKMGAVNGAGLVALSKGINVVDRKVRLAAVNRYRQQNPNSKMSITEIERMLERTDKLYARIP